MSRLGKIPIVLPKGVKLSIQGQTVLAEGPKGKLSRTFPEGITVKVEGDKAITTRANDEGDMKAKHGLVRSLLAGMVKGVGEGFTKTLVTVGVGYRLALQGQSLNISAGFSHPVVFEIPKGVAGKLTSQTELVLTSADKELLGHIADKIRSVRPPEPYKGKGIRYQNEHIQLKEGKAAGKGAK